MGISLNPLINNEEVENIPRNCDGKSLADYYMAYKINEEGALNDMMGGMYGKQPPAGKVIRYDFKAKKFIEDDMPNSGAEEIKHAMASLDKYIIADSKPVDAEISNSELHKLISIIKKWISEKNGPYLGCMGNDISEFKKGAIEDCDDILRYIEFANSINGVVTLSLG